MNVRGEVKYTFEVSARELTHIRHALNIATENSKGSKSAEFKRIHDELTKQVKNTVETYKAHFTSVLEMIVSNDVNE